MLRSKDEGSAFKDATLVVIAHRIDTIIDSDRVLVMDNGCLVENGPPEELVAKGVENGIFAKMVASSRARSPCSGGSNSQIAPTEPSKLQI
jgi:ABC-type multidrug transport system fused ATPase/permease subunit